MSLPRESPISSTVQRPIADTVGTEVVVDDAIVVVVLEAPFGFGAPVANRHPAPGGLNAAMFTIGGGRFFEGPGGWVVGVVVVAIPMLVVGPGPATDVVV